MPRTGWIQGVNVETRLDPVLVQNVSFGSCGSALQWSLRHSLVLQRVAEVAARAGF